MLTRATPVQTNNPAKISTRRSLEIELTGMTHRKNLKQKRKLIRDEETSRSIKRVRAEIAEISKGQKRLREGHKEVQEKFEEIRKEAARLKEETNLIAGQSAANQLRLDLIFQIVKARAENDYVKDAQLTQTLRELMGKAKPEQKQLSENKLEND